MSANLEVKKIAREALALIAPIEKDSKRVQPEVIRQGQIWVVTNNGLVGDRTETITCNACGVKRQEKVEQNIPIGTKIEIRCPYAWHYRTDGDVFFHSDTDNILANCKYYGVVLEEIRFMNRYTLKQILEQGLYEPLPV